MNEEAKRKALRMFSYGLYILTARSETLCTGATVTWVSQSSFKPPQIMMAVRKDSRLQGLLQGGAPFALHILSKDQKKIAETFFKPASCEGNLLAGLEFTDGVTGAPVLTAAPAFIEGRIVDRLDRGDHTVFLADVVEACVRQDATPLSLRDTPWNYGG